MITKTIAARLVFAIALLVAPRVSPGQALIITNIAYAKRDISPLDYYPDDTTNFYQVRGRVTSPHFVTNGSEFYIQDINDNVGIRVDSSSLSPALTLYTELEVIGQISQTAGVRRIMPSFLGDISVTDPNPVSVMPVSGTIASFLANAETYEGCYVVISNVYALTNVVFAWGANANITISDATARITLRVDVDMAIDGQLAPTNAFTLYGIFSQYDASATPTGGYQVLPRFYTDIVQSSTLQPPQIFVVNSNRFSVIVNSPLTVTLIAQDRNPEDNLTLSLTSAPAGANLQLQTQRMWRLMWTPSSSYADTTNFITVAVTDGTFTNQIVLQVNVLSELWGNVKINEIHWDPAPGLAGDANGDGISDTTQDEFVEIVNANTSSVNITGWQLYLGTNLLFTFPPTVLTGRTATLAFGGGTPTGNFGYSIVYAPTSNWRGLANSPGSSAVRLVTESGAEVSAYNYAPFGTPDMSITRHPDYTGDFVLHTSVVSFVRWTPGRMANGKYFEGAGRTNSPPLLARVSDRTVLTGSGVVIPLQAYDPEGNALTFSVSNAPASATLTNYANGMAALSYTGLLSDVGTTYVVAVSVTDGIDDPVRTSFGLTVLDAQYAGLIINEICANPSTIFDSNGDGVFDASADEYVEIVNNTTGIINLAGLLLYDATGLRHRFPSVLIPTGGAIVVFGGGGLSNFWASPAQRASTGTLGINNGAPETIILYTPQTNEITRFELEGTAPIGASLTRYPDLADVWTNHYLVTTNLLRGSPGRKFTGEFFYANVPPVFDAVTNVTVGESNAVTMLVFARAYDGNLITLTVSNLPPGATFSNTPSVGLTTGSLVWATATPAGVYTTSFHAADKDGITTTSIVITVRAYEPPPTSFSAPVVINEFRNSTPDMVELLVISNAWDLRGMLLKDYASDGVTDNGGAYMFATNNLWASVRAGTLIVLRNTNMTMDNVVGGFDYNLDVGLMDTNYFVRLNGSFDIAREEIVQIKLAGSIQPGHVGAVHTLATAGANLTNYAAAPIPKLRAATGNSGTDKSVIALNSTSELSDYNGTNAVGDQTSGSIGTWNTEGNRIFILSLRTEGDRDNDKIPDAWETAYFGCPTCAEPDEDSDDDGFSNLEEYIADTIPVGADGSVSYFAIEDITNTTTRYIQFLSSTGRIYVLQATTNPINGNLWTNTSAEVQGTGGVMSLSDTNAVDRQMYRLRVRLP